MALPVYIAMAVASCPLIPTIARLVMQNFMTPLAAKFERLSKPVPKDWLISWPNSRGLVHLIYIGSDRNEVIQKTR